MCSETVAPRLSFSHDDLAEPQVSPLKDDVPRKDTLLLESNPEFEFSNSCSREFESSCADELFSNGVILPIQMQKEKTTTTRKHTRYGEPPYMKLPPRPCSPTLDKMKKGNTKGVLDVNTGNEKKTQSKSFWGFGRSKSLNCDTKKSFMCSLPQLSRSSSAGSVANPKRTSSNRQQSAAKALSSSSSPSSCSSLNLYPVPRSPSGKSYGGSYSYANGLRVSPVLNVPTPYISKGSASLFGLGSFLRVGKVKKSKN